MRNKRVRERGARHERILRAMELAASIQTMFTSAPFYERFGLARRAGFDSVEFGGWTELDLSRVKAELARHSLRLSAMTGADAFPLVSPDAREGFLEYLSQSLAVAKSFGCRNVIVQSADPDGETAARLLDAAAQAADSADFTGRAAAAQALMDAADQAERAGVTLFLKPSPTKTGCRALTYLHTNSSSGSLVKVINSPALRLLFTFSLSQPIEDSVVATFNKYREHVGYVHIGDANLRVIGKILSGELRYDGTVGFVFKTGADEKERLKEIADAFGPRPD